MTVPQPTAVDPTHPPLQGSGGKNHMPRVVQVLALFRIVHIFPMFLNFFEFSAPSTIPPQDSRWSVSFCRSGGIRDFCLKREIKSLRALESPRSRIFPRPCLGVEDLQSLTQESFNTSLPLSKDRSILSPSTEVNIPGRGGGGPWAPRGRGPRWGTGGARRRRRPRG